MKRKTPIIIALASTIFTGSVFAVGGSVNFTGTISATACTVNDVAGSGSEIGTIDFGTIYSNELLTVNARSTPEPFIIELSNCSSSEAPKITFSGDAVDGANMTLASGVPGVGILIADGDDAFHPYPLNVSGENIGFTNGWQNGDNILRGNFSATVVSMTEGAKTGNIDATMTFTVDYSDI